MDYPYAKSRKGDYRVSRQDSNSNRLRVTQMNDSNDYGFNWLEGGNYDSESSRREEYQMSKREVPEGWNTFGVTVQDGSGNPIRNNVGRTVKENLGATRRVDIGATGETRTDDVLYSPRATRRIDASMYEYAKEGPYYRHPQGPSDSPGREDIVFPQSSAYDYAIDDIMETEEGKPRLWTSVAADKRLMNKMHGNFTKIRTRWDPHSGLDNPVAVSNYSDDESVSSERRGRLQRIAFIVVAVATIIVLAAVIVPVVLVLRSDGTDDEKEVFLKYEYQARITNRNYSDDMANSSSEAFKSVADEFCNQLDDAGENKTNAELKYKGCTVTGITKGSLIINYNLFISLSSSKPRPTSAVVIAIVNIKITSDGVDEQNIGDFTITSVISISVQAVSQNESPNKKAFNEACSVATNDRCVTKFSECVESVCSCPVDRYHDNPTDRCVQIDCGENPTIDNGTVTSNGNKYGDTLNITCDDGHELSDNTTISCIINSDWGALPSCEPVVCEEFIKPNNSNIDANTTGRTFTEDIVVKCIDGYTLDNDSSLVSCQANKSWSESPVCFPIPCQDFHTPDNSVVTPLKQQYLYNDNLTVECDEGYQLDGNNTFGCQANGSWILIPNCTAIACESLVLPNNTAAVFPDQSSYEYNDNVTIQCDNGYELEGDETIGCQANGSWINIPSCFPVFCAPFAIPTNAAISPNKSSYVYNENVTVECESGYKLIGKNVISCLPNGTWVEVPSCIPVECDIFTLPEKSSIETDEQQYSYNDNVTLTCDEGYKLEGDAKVRCQANSSWTSLPSCKAITCQPFVKPDNSEVDSNATEISYNDVINVTCHTGFTLIGESSLSCNTDGTWPDVDCARINCTDDFIPPKNGIVVSKNETTSTFELDCEKGYLVAGNMSVQCIAGNWSESPNCTIVDCGEYMPLMDNHYIESEAVTTYTSSVNVTCVDGLDFTNSSTTFVTCGADGKWHGYPECKIAGEVSYLENIYSVNEGENVSAICEVTDYPDWQTVVVAKMDQENNDSVIPLFILYKNGSIQNVTKNDNYRISTSSRMDGISVSLGFLAAECDDEGTYMCAAIVGDPMMPIESKHASTNVNVSCLIGCEVNVTSTDLYFFKTNATTPLNTSVPVECIKGLNFTNTSITEVTCGSDGQWEGEPECQITGEVSYLENNYSVNEGENVSVICGVTDYPDWQTVVVAKMDQQNNDIGIPLFIIHKNGSIQTINENDNYRISTSSRMDGISVSLGFLAAECDDEGIYMCAAIVGDPMMPIESKQARTNVNVSCLIGCEVNVTSTDFYFFKTNATTPFNTSVPVTCIEGLNFTNTSITEVTCGADGQWEREPECQITGEVSYLENIYSVNEGENVSVICELTDYPDWQTVVVAKMDQENNDSGTPLFILHKNGSIQNVTKNDNYRISTSSRMDGISISLGFLAAECDDEGIYMCAAIVGDPMMPIESKHASTNVNVSCLIGCEVNATSTDKYFFKTNATTPLNTSVPVTCIEGLNFTNTSTTEVICGADGQWEGEPECQITGEVSYLENNYSVNEGETVSVICEVTDYPDWQSVVVAKMGQENNDSGIPLFIIHKNGSIQNVTENDNYRISTSSRMDGISVSLGLLAAECDDEGVYMCAAIVGDPMMPIESKHASTNVNVSCLIGCEVNATSTDLYFFKTNATAPLNTSVPVTCIKGLNFTNTSTTEVTCGSDGQWEGEPECQITGEVSYLENNYSVNEGENVSVICEVTDYPDWQTVVVAKMGQENNDSGIPLFIIHKNGSIQNVTENINYRVSTSPRMDGISVSLGLLAAECDDEGVYMCAAIVGDPMMPIESKHASTNVNVSCLIGCEVNVTSTDLYFFKTNATTPLNTSVPVTCIKGLNFTNTSTTEVTCGSDGQWEGEPECQITGEVSYLENNYSVNEGETVSVICEVTDYPDWQSVVVAKMGQENNDSGIPLFIIHKNGSIQNVTENDNYRISTSSRMDGISVSLGLLAAECDDEGVYMCAAIVGDPMMPIESKHASTNVNVSCLIGCEVNATSTDLYFFKTNATAPLNTSVPVTCIKGLNFTNTSTTEVTCGSDGQWEGEPECQITGEVSYLENNYSVNEGENVSVICEVTDYPDWQTVVVAKMGQENNDSGIPLFIIHKNGSIQNVTENINYRVSTSPRMDGISVSLGLLAAECDDEGVYMCAAIVGDPMMPIESKHASTNVNVSCLIGCEVNVTSTDLYFFKTNATTPLNTSVPVTCIKGLNFTNTSTTEVTCGSDGQWEGEPECQITGEVSYLENNYSVNEGENVSVICGVTDYPDWQTVVVAKMDQKNNDIGIPLFIIHKNGSIQTINENDNYRISTSSRMDGISVSLGFLAAECDDEGVYMCAAIVGDPMMPIESKQARTNVNVSCLIGCEVNVTSTDLYFFKTNATTPFNTSVPVTCIEGLNFTNTSITEVTCGSDGQWEREPECQITGEVSYLKNIYSVIEGENVSVICEVTDYPDWQTVVVAKMGQENNASGIPLFIIHKNGSIQNVTKNDNYRISTSSRMDGISVSLGLLAAECDDEGVYMCAAIVGDPMMPIESKHASTNVNVSCLIGCEKYVPTTDMFFVEINETTALNTSVPVTCIKGLNFTNTSTTEVICGADGQWEGEPECQIPGEVSYSEIIYSANEGENVSVICEVTDYPDWQTVVVAKMATENDTLIPYFIIYKNGSIQNEIKDNKYGISTSPRMDAGVSISLSFNGANCDDEGIYVCAAVVGDPRMPIETKSGSTNLSVSCSIIACEEYELGADTYLVQTNRTTPVNTSLSVTCIDGLDFANESTTEVTCGADGKWEGEPKCKIPGKLAFTKPTYSFKIGETGIIICKVTENTAWEKVLVRKVNIDDTLIMPIVLVSNGNGTVPVESVLNDSYSVNTTLIEDGVSVAVTLSHTTCDSEGVYMCAAVVGDPEDPTDIKTASTNVTFLSDSSSPEINVPDTVYLGRETKVHCKGRIGKGLSGESTGKLFMVTNFGANSSTAVYNGSDTPEEDGCYFTDKLSVSIPTNSDSSSLWAKCVIEHINGTGANLESEQKNISIQSSFVAFEQPSYIFNIGEEANLTCDVENIPEWKMVEIKSHGRVFVTVNSSNMLPQTLDSHIRLGNESFASNTSGRQVVVFDPVQCNDTADGVGDVEFTCTVASDNETLEAKTLVTFQRLPSPPELTLSDQIIEGKYTWADKPFKCTGDIGDPPGYIEVESDFEGDFGMFITFGSNESSFGVISNDTEPDGDCRNHQTVVFELKNIDKKYMHLKNLRCVTKPSADLVNGNVLYSEQKVVKVVPENYCESSATGSTIHIPHPYYCNFAVICNADGTVNAVTPPCFISGYCAVKTPSSNFMCSACDPVADECITKGIQCDETSVTGYAGNSVSFTCNTQDFGKVEHISVNSLIDGDVGDAGETIQVNDVTVKVDQFYAMLSFANLSCDQEGDYVITLNNETDFTLTLAVISEPDDPVMSLPAIMIANKDMKVNCSGKVGRDEEGKNKTAIYLEIISQDPDEVLMPNGHETRMFDDSDCEISEAVTFSIIPDVRWNNSMVRCIARNMTALVSYSSSVQLVLEKPALFCQPSLQKSEIGGSVIFTCAMKGISSIASVVVTKNVSQLISADNATLPLVQEYNSDFTLTIPSLTDLLMDFSNVTCEQEGVYQVKFNDDESVNISLRVISSAMEPSLNKPSTGRVNEEFEISCSGDIGRDEEGIVASNLYLEIKLVNESDFSIYEDDVIRESPKLSNCQYTETIRLTFFPDASWNNSMVRCVARNESDIMTSSTTQEIIIFGPNIYFESTDLTGVVSETLILTCIVANIPDLSDIAISRGTNKTTIATYSSMSESNNVKVLTEESSINGSAGVLKINVTLQCGDDGEYHCKPTGTGPSTEAVTSVQLQRKPSEPTLNMSREIIENKYTLDDRLFFCEGDLGDPPGTMEIQSNFNGSFETFLSPEPGLGNNSVGWIVSDDVVISSCGNIRTIGFAFHNVTMDLQSERLRCIIHPASDFSVSIGDMYDEKSINIIPSNYCVGKPEFTSHPYFCYLRVWCNSDGSIYGVPKGCADENECIVDIQTSHCNITESSTTTDTTTTTPSPDIPYLSGEDLTDKYGEIAEVTFSLNNIVIDFNNLTESPVTVMADNGIGLIFDSSRDNLSDSNSFVTSNGVEIALATDSIKLKFVPLQCQHVGKYTFQYSSLDTSSHVDIVANITTPIISKVPDNFYQNQKASLICTGDVGRPKGDLVIQSKADGDWQTVDVDVTQTNSETSNCTTLTTVSHGFYVDENVAGQQYRCKSEGDNGEVLTSDEELVQVSDAVVYFTESAVTAEIGSNLLLKCVLQGNLASNGAVISRNSILLGKEQLCNVTSTGAVTCGSERITGSAEVSTNNMTISVTVNAVECEDEGTLFCGSVSDSSLQALVALSVTRLPESDPMLTVPIRMVVDVTEHSGKISCTANVGYPAGIVRIEYMSDNSTSYEPFSLGTLESPTEESEGCSVNKTVVFGEYKYTQSWNNTHLRCAVYNNTDAQTPTKVSDIKTITLIDNECVPGITTYHHHPINCHYIITCVSGSSFVTDCGESCPGNTDSTTHPGCHGNCTTPGC